MNDDGGVFPVADPVRSARVVKAPVRLVVQSTESIKDGAAKAYDLFMRDGRPEEAARATREVYGGECPICRRPYLKVTTKNRYADFQWFRPDCACEDTEEDKKNRSGRARAVLMQAGVPEEYLGSTFESWDYGAEESINAAMREVFRFAKDKDFKDRGLILYGSVGTGKTRCAVSVLRRAAADGLDVMFVKMAEIVGRFADREKGKRFVDALLARDMVLFDDLDKIGSLENAWVSEQVFRVFDGLLTSRRRIVATSNLPDYDSFEKKFGEAVISRLVGGCQFVKFVGEDYRKRRAEMERKNRELGNASGR